MNPFRKYVNSNNPAPFLGALRQMSFHADNMGLAVSRQRVTTKAGEVILTRAGGIDYVKITPTRSGLTTFSVEYNTSFGKPRIANVDLHVKCKSGKIYYYDFSSNLTGLSGENADADGCLISLSSLPSSMFSTEEVTFMGYPFKYITAKKGVMVSPGTPYYLGAVEPGTDELTPNPDAIGLSVDVQPEPKEGDVINYNNVTVFNIDRRYVFVVSPIKATLDGPFGGFPSSEQILDSFPDPPESFMIRVNGYEYLGSYDESLSGVPPNFGSAYIIWTPAGENWTTLVRGDIPGGWLVNGNYRSWGRFFRDGWIPLGDYAADVPSVITTYTRTLASAENDFAPLGFKVSFWNLYAALKPYPSEALFSEGATQSQIMAQITANLNLGKVWPENALEWYYEGDGMTPDVDRVLSFNALNPEHSWMATGSAAVAATSVWENNNSKDIDYISIPPYMQGHAVVPGTGQPYIWIGQMLSLTEVGGYSGRVYNSCEQRSGGMSFGGYYHYKIDIQEATTREFLANNIICRGRYDEEGPSIYEFVAPGGSAELSMSITNPFFDREYDDYYGHYVETYYKLIGGVSGSISFSGFQLPGKNTR